MCVGSCFRYPVTYMTLNYAPVAVGIVLVGALASFFCPVIGARHWYRGERHTVVNFTVRTVAMAPFLQVARTAQFESSSQCEHPLHVT